MPWVQLSTATAYGAPKKLAISFSNLFTISKLILKTLYLKIDHGMVQFYTHKL